MKNIFKPFYKMVFVITQFFKLPPKFSVEYYPLTNRFYPKYRNYYLNTNWATGIIDYKDAFLFQFADYADSEQGAWDKIERFKEQQLKENIKTLTKNY